MNYTTNYNLNLPSFNNSADISALNENFSKIDEKLKDNADAIASVKITTDTTVKEGSKNPVSGGAVYEALQNIEIDVDNAISNTSENPVQNKVVKAYVDDVVSRVDVGIIETGKNLIDESKLETGALNSVTGEEIENANFKRTPYIYLETGTYVYSNKGNSYSSFRVCIYDLNKSLESTKAGAGNNTFTIDSPKYIRIHDGSSRTNMQLELGTTPTEYEPYYQKIKYEYIPVDKISEEVISNIPIDEEMSDTSENSVKNNVVKAYIDEAVKNIDIPENLISNNRCWAKKKLIAFGTSITWACRNYDGGYLRIVKDRNEFAEYRNEGVSGAAMANNTTNGNGINYKIKSSTIIGNYDLVIIECSTNDFKLNVSLGEVGLMGDTEFDTDTFCGALRDSIEHILTNYPQKHILLIADTQRNNAGYDVNYTNSAGHKLIDYIDALKSIAELYGLPVCDWYRKSGFNALTLSQYTTDGLHPNALGYVVLGNLTASAVAEMYCNFEVVISDSGNDGGTDGGELVFADVDTVFNTGYISSVGATTPQTSGNWQYTDMIATNSGETFKYIGSTSPGTTNIPSVCGYNASGSFVKIILEKGNYIEGKEFTIPDDVSNIRCCYYIKDTVVGIQKGEYIAT